MFRIQQYWGMDGTISSVANSMTHKEFVLRCKWLKKELQMQADLEGERQARLEAYLQQIAYEIAKSNQSYGDRRRTMKMENFELKFTKKPKQPRQRTQQSPEEILQRLKLWKALSGRKGQS